MDSDRVLVMSEGKVAEYDTPEKLLENHVCLSVLGEGDLGADDCVLGECLLQLGE